MNYAFQLIEAQTGSVRVPLPWRRRERVWMNPEVDVVHGAGGTGVGAVGHLTAIIGRNGTGKSRLLSALAESFTLLENAALTKAPFRGLPLQRLVYRIGDDNVAIEQRQPDFAIELNGRPAEIADIPLPRRVVALTLTPFDKFVVPRAAPFSVSPSRPSLYRYLGLRDRTGRASVDNLLYRSLASLFETAENEAVRRARIEQVFEFLELEPQVRVVYRVVIPRELTRAAEAGAPIVTERTMRNSYRLRRARDVLKSSDVTDEQLRDLILLASKIAIERFITLSANFGSHGNIDERFRQLVPLRRTGYLQLRAVEVTHKHGYVTDLKRASSGQLSTATALLSLASEIQDGSLVLIDEPELSLHPAWQVKYVELLLSTFKNYSGCHFIIATHSPMVISELPENAGIVSLDRDNDTNTTDALSGQSADLILAEAFGVPTNHNLYVEQEIIAALRMAADGNIDDPEFKQRVRHLQRFAEKMDPDSPVRVVIEGLEGVAEQARKDNAAD